jgi:hypothetical protein
MQHDGEGATSVLLFLKPGSLAVAPACANTRCDASVAAIPCSTARVVPPLCGQGAPASRATECCVSSKWGVFTSPSRCLVSAVRRRGVSRAGVPRSRRPIGGDQMDLRSGPFDPRRSSAQGLRDFDRLKAEQAPPQKASAASPSSGWISSETRWSIRVAVRRRAAVARADQFVCDRRLRRTECRTCSAVTAAAA